MKVRIYAIALVLIVCICATLALWAARAYPAPLPPDPDNAALLYYQAFLRQPEPNVAIGEFIDNVLRGAEPN
ncbi:MAG: hypothetical protein ACYS80_09740 [Planctomycetota bacterium]|jgi:hypothetical protein